MNHYYRAIVAALLGTLSVAGTGCTKTSSCDHEEDMATVSLAPGMVQGDTYHSAPFGGPYQAFPPNRTVSFEHGLGVEGFPEIVPTVQFWLAFTPDGALAPSAGNFTELRIVEGEERKTPLDDKRISVRNNTCSNVYLWVVATRPNCTGTWTRSADDVVTCEPNP